MAPLFSGGIFMDYISIYDWTANISSENKEGYLIADNVSEGNMLIKHCAKKLDTLCGISAISIRDMAFSIAVQGISGLKMPVLIDADAAVSILSDIVSNDSDISFIPNESICDVTLKDVYSKICQIRSGGVKTIDSSKLRIDQLLKVLELFEKELSQRNYYDECRALSEALKFLEGKDYGLNIAVTEDKNLNHLQKLFLQKATSKGSLSFVRMPGKLSDIPHGNVHFYKGYGLYNEVRYCLDKIQKEKMAYGDCAMICAHSAYIPYIEAIFGGADVPYTLSDNKSALYFRRVQLIDQILSFAQEGFIYESLRPVFMGEGVSLGEGIDAGKVFVRCIRDNIGMGRERFLNVIDRRLSDEESSEAKEECVLFYKFLKEIIEVFPKNNETVRPINLLLGLDSILKKKLSLSLRKESKLSGSAIDEIAGKLRFEKECRLPECIEMIRDAIKKSSVGEGECGDAVFVATMGRTIISDRKNLFFIGLSNTYFMQDTTQSPVLTDEELSEIVVDTDGLSFASENGVRFTDSFLSSLRAIDDPSEKKIFFGTSVYNAIKLQEDSPAPIYHELQKQFAPGLEDTGVELLDYGELGKVVPLTKKEDDTTKEKPDEEKKDAENDENSVAARIAEFAKNPSFSPSAFQVLVSCPRKYYYNYILKIPKEEYSQVNTETWLNGAAKGNFFHYTLERYANAVLIENENVGRDIDEATFEKAFAEAEKIIIEECPYVSIEVKEHETALVKKVCRDYVQKLHIELNEEQRGDKKWKVKGCELPLSDCEHDPILVQDSIIGISTEEELEKTKGQKNTPLTLVGNIDRLDHYFDEKGVEHLRIIDYKTGNMEKFTKKLSTHTQLQHVFYSLGVTKNGKSVVDTMKYVFPFDMQEIERKGQELVLPSDVEQRYTFSCAAGRYSRNFVDKELDYPDSVMREYCSYCNYGQMGICPEMLREKE